MLERRILNLITSYKRRIENDGDQCMMYLLNQRTDF